MFKDLTRIFGSLKAGIATGATVALAVMLPVAVTAQDTAKLGGSLGVANLTAGDTEYQQSVNASQGQAVMVRLYYVNQEAADSNKAAQAVRAKITMPAGAGKVQTVKSSVKGTNTDANEHQVTVNADRDDAVLQYIPGTAVWKHNTGSADAVKVVETKLSDELVTGAQGVALEDVKPGEAFAGTISIQARLVSPGVKLTVQSQKQGATNQWSANNTANPGDTMRVMIGYQNTGGTAQNSVLVRDSLPANVTLVPGTTTLTNAANPDGLKVGSDAVSAAGINIGNYAAGANAFVTFEVKLPAADKLACGDNALRNTAIVKPEGLSEHYATSVTTVKRDCSGGGAPATPKAAFSCDSLTVTKKDGRAIEATVAYTARDGAKLKTVTYDFGDGKEPLTTDKTTVPYTYDKDGTYTVSTSLLMTVNGKDQTVTNDAACSKAVAVTTTPTPSAPSANPGALPDTGPGEVVGLFAAAAIAGTLFHRRYLTRYLS